MPSTYSEKLCAVTEGMGRYPGSRLNRVGMSVEPWMVACPRSAMMPPPGRPMLPSSSCRIEAVRMNCAPSVCWVHPTAYAKHVVRCRPEFSVTERAR